MRAHVLFVCMLAAISAQPSSASTPPPPPPYVMAAGALLIAPGASNSRALMQIFADDLQATLDGRPLVTGKTAWLRWRESDGKQRFGRTIGYSMGPKGAGVLLVVEQYDHQDHASSLPPPGDARPVTRTTFYRFGTDGLIHRVEISEVDSFFALPRRRSVPQ